jgi:hypothetical protein
VPAMTEIHLDATQRAAADAIYAEYQRMLRDSTNHVLILWDPDSPKWDLFAQAALTAARVPELHGLVARLRAEIVSLRSSLDVVARQRDAGARRVEGLERTANEFVQLGSAFPHAPLGPNTKGRFVASFRAALGEGK